jgi:hypothetical protein
MTAFSPASDLGPNDYCVLGLATCFLREDGALHPIEVIEPVPSAALEAIFKDVPTSYQQLVAVALGEIASETEFPKPQSFPAGAQWCENFQERLLAAARSYQSRPQSRDLIPLGDSYEPKNYSLERKRVLNAAHLVRPEDNVKQHPLTHQTL